MACILWQTRTYSIVCRIDMCLFAWLNECFTKIYSLWCASTTFFLCFCFGRSMMRSTSPQIRFVKKCCIVHLYREIWHHWCGHFPSPPLITQMPCKLHKAISVALFPGQHNWGSTTIFKWYKQQIYQESDHSPLLGYCVNHCKWLLRLQTFQGSTILRWYSYYI